MHGAVTRPASIFDISSTELIRLSRCSPLREMIARCSLCCWLSAERDNRAERLPAWLGQEHRAGVGGQQVLGVSGDPLMFLRMASWVMAHNLDSVLRDQVWCALLYQRKRHAAYVMLRICRT
jgi:hypothetical protein